MSGLTLRIYLFITLLLTTSVLTHNEVPARFGRRSPELVKRQEPYPSDSGPEYSIPPLESITPLPQSYSENTLPVEATYSPGTQPTLTSAPVLPSGEYFP
jgi:hypothetical protein